MSLESINLTQPCFCGSNCNFTACCQPYIDKVKPVETAEQLMRSRFSAYALGNAQYIYDTYAKSSRAAQSVEDINDWSRSCIWLALNIYPVANNPIKTTEQFVEFSVFYITNNILYELQENSRFILEDNIDIHENVIKNIELTSTTPLKQWRYIDGDIIAHNKLANIKRNRLCPCNHYPSTWKIEKGKKFKQCCGK